MGVNLRPKTFNEVNIDHSFEDQNNFAMWGETRFIPLMGQNGIFDKCSLKLYNSGLHPTVKLLHGKKLLVQIDQYTLVHQDLRVFIDKPVMEDVFSMVFMNYLLQKRIFPYGIFNDVRRFKWMKEPEKLQGSILSVIDEDYFAFSGYENGERKGTYFINEGGKISEIGFISKTNPNNWGNPDVYLGVSFKKDNYIPNWG